MTNSSISGKPKATNLSFISSWINRKDINLAWDFLHEQYENLCKLYGASSRSGFEFENIANQNPKQEALVRGKLVSTFTDVMQGKPLFTMAQKVPEWFQLDKPSAIINNFAYVPAMRAPKDDLVTFVKLLVGDPFYVKYILPVSGEYTAHWICSGSWESVEEGKKGDIMSRATPQQRLEILSILEQPHCFFLEQTTGMGPSRLAAFFKLAVEGISDNVSARARIHSSPIWKVYPYKGREFDEWLQEYDVRLV